MNFQDADWRGKWIWEGRSHRTYAEGIRAPGFRSFARTGVASLCSLERMVCGGADMGLAAFAFCAARNCGV